MQLMSARKIESGRGFQIAVWSVVFNFAQLLLVKAYLHLFSLIKRRKSLNFKPWSRQRETISLAYSRILGNS